MSKLGVGLGQIGKPATYVVDMRDEIITTIDQFYEVVERFREGHIEKIGSIRLCPTQMYCLSREVLVGMWNAKENRAPTLEEMGELKQLMGIDVFVNKENI